MQQRPILIALGVGAAILVVVVAVIAGNSGASGSSALVGHPWKLTSYTETAPAFQGVVPAADQARYTITFGDAGTFSGTADCNQVSGTYETSGSDGLTITPGVSTMAFCGEGTLGDLYVHALSRRRATPSWMAS